MALAKKCALLYKLRADVAVIPECSRDAILNCRNDGYSTYWWGDNKNKGLGVVAAKPWVLKAGGQPRQKWVAPVHVLGPLNFLLIAVWASPIGNSKELNYIGQVYEAIAKHPKWLSGKEPVVLCGDFNSNTIWDSGRKIRNHSAVVRMLSDRAIVSAYHNFFLEDHGRETRPTYYFWHREERCFHIDYIFVPRSWNITDVKVGTYSAWRSASDHVPVLVDIAEPFPPACRHVEVSN